MQILSTEIEGVLELVPVRHGDARGHFSELYSQRRFSALGLPAQWVQDNLSLSAEVFTLRGLHFQVPPQAQAKLVTVVTGAVYDVAVDLRTGSPTQGRWLARTLSAEKGNQLLIPEGFAHGFLTLQPDTRVFYKVSAPYDAASERTIRYDDARLAIDWPLAGSQPILSGRDAAAHGYEPGGTGF